MPYDQNFIIGDIHFSTTFTLFLERIRTAIGLQVANRSLPRGRQIELTQGNWSLLNAWMRWVAMGLSENTVVSMDALFHRRDDGYVESITFSCRTPVPPSHLNGFADEPVDATRHTPPPPTTISSGASGAPEPSFVSQWLQSLDTHMQEASAAVGVAEIGADALAVSTQTARMASVAFAAEGLAATVGTIGAVLAIPAGVCVLADAPIFREQVAYYRGFVLAIADMAQPTSPTARRDEGGRFHTGRRDAVRFIRHQGEDGIAFLCALRYHYPSGQARVNHLWNDILQNRFTTEHDRNLARPLRPSF